MATMPIRWGNGVPQYHADNDGSDRLYVCQLQGNIWGDLRYCMTHPADKLDVARNWMKAAVAEHPYLKLMLIEVSGTGRKLMGKWPLEQPESAKLKSWGEF